MVAKPVAAGPILLTGTPGGSPTGLLILLPTLATAHALYAPKHPASAMGKPRHGRLQGVRECSCRREEPHEPLVPRPLPWEYIGRSSSDQVVANAINYQMENWCVHKCKKQTNIKTPSVIETIFRRLVSRAEEVYKKYKIIPTFNRFIIPYFARHSIIQVDLSVCDSGGVWGGCRWLVTGHRRRHRRHHASQ